jgi:hypothetical protein
MLPAFVIMLPAFVIMLPAFVIMLPAFVIITFAVQSSTTSNPDGSDMLRFDTRFDSAFYDKRQEKIIVIRLPRSSQ